MLRWLKLAAEKKNPNYTLWYKDGEVAGVFDKKADTVWRTHTITTEFPNKKHKAWMNRDTKFWEDGEMVFQKLQKLCLENGFSTRTHFACVN